MIIKARKWDSISLGIVWVQDLPKCHGINFSLLSSLFRQVSLEWTLFIWASFPRFPFTLCFAAYSHSRNFTLTDPSLFNLKASLNNHPNMSVCTSLSLTILNIHFLLKRASLMIRFFLLLVLKMTHAISVFISCRSPASSLVCYFHYCLLLFGAQWKILSIFHTDFYPKFVRLLFIGSRFLMLSFRK